MSPCDSRRDLAYGLLSAPQHHRATLMLSLVSDFLRLGFLSVRLTLFVHVCSLLWINILLSVLCQIPRHTAQLLRGDLLGPIAS